MAGGCRFALDGEGNVPLACASESGRRCSATHNYLFKHEFSFAGGEAAVRKVFASGIDYWQRTRHGGHAWVMKEVVRTAMLIRNRLKDHTPASPAVVVFPDVPEEIWLAVLGFVRSADFMQQHVR